MLTDALGPSPRVMASRMIADADAPERRQRRVTVNLAESPASWLLARGHLDKRQYAASELLRRDFEQARLIASTTMRWDPVRHKCHASNALHASERQLAARQRFDAAMAHAGADLSDILWRVSCAGDSLARCERALNWPARSGKLVLRIALDRIADFYRLPAAGPKG